MNERRENGWWLITSWVSFLFEWFMVSSINKNYCSGTTGGDSGTRSSSGELRLCERQVAFHFLYYGFLFGRVSCIAFFWHLI